MPLPFIPRRFTQGGAVTIPSSIHRGDLDGFFGLFVDNLLQIMLIVVLGGSLCGFPPEMIAQRILPGVALSVVFGNLFYTWRARQLARRSCRDDVTALPYGINTVSLMAFIFLVMAPVFRETGNAELAWRVGLFACFLNAVMELIGAFVADWLRRHTPRAALLSALAGIAITFIGMGFAFQIFSSPLVALLPMLLLITVYAGRVRLPWGLPGGLVAVLLGVALAWLSRWFGWASSPPEPQLAVTGLHWPQPAVADMLALIDSPLGWKYLAVILPMGLLNILGSLQNLESAEAAGDRYETRNALLANGFGSLIAASFGSAFPTTIYIGHPAWKAMGARQAYSVLNAIVIAALCFTGLYAAVVYWVPLEATLGILVWIGLIITAQAFQETPARHALAVSIGLLPSLAAWGLLLVESALRAAGSSLAASVERFGGDLHVHGLIALSQGFVFSASLLAAILAHVIDRRFDRAAGWALAAAGLAWVGIIHAYRLTDLGVENHFGFGAAPDFALAYALMALMLWGLHRGGQGARSG
jgi:AGZA family xanthine/uracil permease-like MFS transporter